MPLEPIYSTNISHSELEVLKDWHLKEVKHIQKLRYKAIDHNHLQKAHALQLQINQHRDRLIHLDRLSPI